MKLFRNKITAGILIASQFMYGVPVYAEKYTSEPTPRINGRAPVASNLAFDKLIPAFGDTVTLTYDFSDLDGDLEQGTTVQWLRDGQPIQGATAFSYTVDESNGDRPGERLSVEVTPRTDPARSEPSVGQVASLETTVYGDPAAKPVVSDLNIVGKLSIGEALTGVYSYDDNGTGSADASNKQWLNGGHASTDLSYALDAGDVGKVLTFEVEAKNLAGTVGNKASIDTATATGVTGGGQLIPGAVVDSAAKPVVDVTDITGTLQVGQSLTGVYSYDDNGTGSADASNKQWLNGGHASTDLSYALDAGDVGKVLTFEVEAKNLAGTVGNKASIDTATATGVTGGGQLIPGAVVDSAAKPVVDVTDITGTLQVGQSLTGVYSYDDNGTGSADASNKQWLNGGHASTDLSYALDAGDVGKVLTFEVEAKNLAGTVGNKASIDTATATGVTGGGQLIPGAVVDSAAKPVVDVTDITGTLQVGQSLTGVYSYDDNGTGSADASNKQWLNGGHASTDLSYALDAGDVGKVLTFEVEAKNLAGTVGNKASIDTATATGVTGGGQLIPGAVVDSAAKPVVDVTDITGTLQVGQSLTGVYSYDDNGTGSADASNKQWLNGGHASTDLSYALDAGDVGKVLTFEVEAKNLAGTVGNKASIDTATATGVTGGGQLIPGAVVDSAAKPVVDVTDITGTLQVGQSLTGVYSYDDNGTGSADASNKQWLNGGHASTDLSYALDAGDVGKVLTFEVEAKNLAGTVGNKASIDTATATGVTGGGQLIPGAVVDSAAKPVVDVTDITGTLQVGQSLTGVYSYDDNGTGSADASNKQWLNGGHASTDLSYALDAGDVGKVLTFEVEAKNLAGTVGNKASIDTATATGVTGGGQLIPGAVVDSAAKPVVDVTDITGTLQVGQSLTGVYSYDDNGTGSADASNKQWLNGGHASTDLSYALDAGDVGKVLTFEVEAKNLAGTVGNKASIDTAMATGVTGGGQLIPGAVVDSAAKPVVDVTDITGTLQVGQSLTGVYSYDDNGTGSADASNKQWLNGGHASTDLSYALDAGDVGKVLTFEVEAKNLAGTVGNKASIDTATATGVTGGGQLIPGAVVDSAAKPVVDVTDITGTLQVGQSLTGVYSYDDNGTGSADASNKQWLNGGHASTDLSYALDAGDVGKVLTFEVEAKNLAGTVGNKASIDTATATGVTGGGQLIPGAVVDSAAKPVVDVTDITGTLQVGQSLTGVYSYDDNGTGSADASNKQWLNGGHASTDLSYALDAGDVGKVLTFEVEAKNLAGTVGNKASIDTATATGVTGGGQLIPGAVVDSAAKPVVDVTDITGTLQVGQSLTGVYSYDDNGTGSADASNKQWLNGGHASTDLSYALDAGDVGKVLTFEVEAKNLAGTVGNKASIDTATATGVTGGGQLIPGAVVDPLAKPVITHLKISGTLNVGENLSGRYIYDANGTGSKDASTYSWAHSGQSAAGIDQNAIVISGYVPPYLVADNDVGKVLEVSVQAKNLAGVVGNTETLDTFTSNDVNGGDGNGGVVDLNAAPAITNLLIAGKLEVGQSLTASYDFNANNGAPLDKSTYVWGYKNATAAMVGSGSTVVASGMVPPRLLLSADAGKVLEVSVQAKNLAGVVGNTETLDTVTSNDVNGGDGNGGVVDLNAAPLITNLTLSGKLEVGEDLTGSYAFDANNGAPGDASTYVWGYKNATATTVGGGHLVLTSGSVPAYTIGSLDAGQVLEVSVQAKNLAGVVGNTETLDTLTSNDVNGGDGNGGVVDLNAAPAITNLLIAGKLEVGQSLTASYGFNANNGAPGDASTYVWGYKNATAAMVGSGSTVVASGMVPPRLLLSADAGKVLEVSVQAKNNAATPVVGNRLTVTSSAGATGGGTGGTVINPTAAPAITNLLIAGKLEVGQSLTASYDFNANNGAPLDKSTYAWGYKGATATTVGSGSSVVSSGTVPERALVAADVGQVMEVSVQAKNNAAIPVVGNKLTVTSSAGATGGGTGGAVVNPTSAPTISSLLIGGTLNVGQSLTASYTFNANNGAPLDKSTYVWGYKNATAAMVGSGSIVVTSGTVPARVLVAADAGQVMEVSVQAKNNADTSVVGNTLTVNSSAGTATGGGNGGTVPLIDLFIKPDNLMRNWIDADSYCKAQGARLPTMPELTALFKNATSGAVPNVEMCAKHGWPLKGQCGGTNDYYWSSTGISGYHSYNTLSGVFDNSTVYADASPLQVTCVRPRF